VVVDNRAGAGGVIGMTAAARAVADGHTVGLGNLSDLVVSRYAQPNVPYDPAKDFAPVSTLAKVSIVVSCLPTFPAKSFQEFLALAKATRVNTNAAPQAMAPWAICALKPCRPQQAWTSSTSLTAVAHPRSMTCLVGTSTC